MPGWSISYPATLKPNQLITCWLVWISTISICKHFFWPWSISQSKKRSWPCSGKSHELGVINARSLVNKLSKFQSLLYLSSFSVTVVTETWLSQSISQWNSILARIAVLKVAENHLLLLVMFPVCILPSHGRIQETAMGGDNFINL